MKKGFTLIEMMTVIGIIALLMGLGFAGYGRIVAHSRKAKTQELVSNAATALTMLLQEGGVWPKAIRDDHGTHKLTASVCGAFVNHGNGLMGIKRKKDSQSGRWIVDPDSADRFGLVDSYAQAVIRRSGAPSLDDSVPSGGTIDNHILRFAVDLDGDGKTELPNGKQVRATACVWSLGADGKESPTRSKGDDVYSWSQLQEVR